MKRLTLAAAVFVFALAATAQEAVRPEVGKPLQAAADLIKAKRYREALAKVDQADAVPGKTAAEDALVERMRLSAALSAGNNDRAAKAFEALAAAGRIPQAEQLRIMESLAGGYWRANDKAKAVQWAQRHLREGGTSASMRQLLAAAQAESGDYGAIARQLQAEVAEAEKAGRVPPEDRLKSLAYAQQQINDTAGYVATIEKLAVHYPNKDYWADLITRVQRTPNFSSRYHLDIYRLKIATGNLSQANDYMEMAQLAVQARLSPEAMKVVQAGYAARVLGTGPEAARHQRLKALVEAELARDKESLPSDLDDAQAARGGDALVAVGFRYVMAGDAAKGATLIEQGIAKGQLKRPDEAQLRLGIAQLRAGNKAKGTKTLRAIKGGGDGAGELAHLYALQGAKG